MKLTALTTTKIEGDIIEEFVRHTLRFVDRVIVLDNGSLDGAPVILGELIAEGLPVSVWEGEAIPSGSDGWTAFARRAFDAFDTDYLLMLDVDEFIRAASRASLEAALESLGGAHADVPWVTYVPTPDDDAHEARVLACIRHRLYREKRPYSKVFVHRSFMEQAQASIVQGNHAVISADHCSVSRNLTDVQLAHIPVRSLLQLQSKAVLGWPAVLTMGFTEQQTIGYQWRRLNERLLKESAWDSNELYRFAWHYLDEDEDAERPELVLDPLPPVERLYPHPAPELLPLAMAFSRQLARIYAVRTSELGRDLRKVTTMLDSIGANSPTNGHVVETDAAQIYGEAYFKHYHTGFGPVAYERNGHWLGFFATVADEIVRSFRPDTVLDAGCALGVLVESLWDRGVKAQGLDVSRYAIDNVRPDMRSHCRVATLTDPIQGTFDLVTCIEVLEHLETADAETAIANICNVTDTVLFSSTPSDFTEPTHVNVCPPIRWIELFAGQGFGPDLLADGTFLSSHTMVFRRGNPCDGIVQKAYAMTIRYRMLCSERLDVIALERNNAHVAKQAQAHAEGRLAEETQLRIEASAALGAERFEIEAARAAQRAADSQLVIAAQLQADSLAAAEGQLAAAHSRERNLAEALAASVAESLSYETQLHNLKSSMDDLQNRIHHLHRLVHDLQHSNSWRLTQPFRLAGMYVRDKLKPRNRQT